MPVNTDKLVNMPANLLRQHKFTYGNTVESELLGVRVATLLEINSKQMCKHTLRVMS